MRKYVPSYSGTLRSHGLTLPHCISECSGIRIFGKRFGSHLLGYPVLLAVVFAVMYLLLRVLRRRTAVPAGK